MKKLEERHFRVERGPDWEIGYFTRPQREAIGEFDRDREDELVMKCAETVLEVFSNPNKFERRIARTEGIDLDHPYTKKLYNNVIYTDSPEFYCWGSGGVGGGKVMWTPYTAKEEVTKDNAINATLGCDNCYITSHEDQHGIGSHAELDTFGEAVSADFQLGHLPPEMHGYNLIGEIDMGAIYTQILRGKKEKKKYIKPLERLRRNFFCAVYTRNENKVAKILRNRGYAEDRIQYIADECE